MEMWLKPLILMLFTVEATAMAISHHTSIFLNEMRQTVSVPAGSTLALHCCLSTVGYQRYRITWQFNNSELSFDNSNKMLLKAIYKQNSTDDCEDISKTYILSNVNITNTGWYFCNITGEIPLFKQISSNGTEVVVLHSEVPKYRSNVTDIKDPDVQSGNWQLWLVLGVSSFILLVLALICVLLTRRRENRDEPVYANTRYPNKQPSPRPDMSGAAGRLKTASSSQNLRTPSPARYDEGKRRDKH